MKIDKRIKAMLYDYSRSFKERVFIVFTMTAVAVALLATIGDIIYKENIVEIIMLCFCIVITPLTTLWGVKFNKVDQATKLISLGVIFIIMPVTFIFGGGISGGGIPWLVFSFLYIGLVLSGGWRTFMLLVLTSMVTILYYIGYNYPQLIYQHDNITNYIDSALAVIEVGFVCFVMTWFQGLLYNAENIRAKEETKKVEELNRSQNRFFSSMSHEIRTPINSILGLNEIILRQQDASDEILKDAANIQGSGRMLLSLINDILDFSKIEAGKMDIVPVNYNIGNLVSEIVNMMWLRAEQKGLELKIEIDPTIPAELFGDEVRIKQILVNLLNNAVKYTNEGSVILHVEKDDLRDDGVVLLFSITDTGMGIKKDALPYLFDAFKRVDEGKNAKIEGTGLGLSIVKQLVGLMGGTITVNSVYMQGSTFMVTLWQKVTRPDAIGNINITNFGGKSNYNMYEAGFTAPDVCILIVDDNELNLEVEKKLLTGTRIKIDTAKTGETALAMTLDKKYDIILMDHLMPEMDGIECMQHIRKQIGGLNNRTPVIVLTANAGSENRELYSRSGFDDYLVKPVSGRQLEEMILDHIPSSKIMMNKNSDFSKHSLNTAKGYSRRIPVVITTNTLCDLPRNVINEYQIDIMPFIICNEGKSYYDRIEVETDELLRYMNEGFYFSSRTPSQEDYEIFFGKELKKAHNVIYISMASGVSDEYNNAMAAAKAYDNVIVYDSKSNSSSMGMLVLLAQKLASRGESPEKIINELDKAREKLHCGVVTNGAYFVNRRAAFSDDVGNAMRTLNVWPFIRYKNGKYSVGKLCLGEAEKCYLKYVDFALPRKANPDLDVIFVVYSELSIDILMMIESLIKKRFNFKHIIFQKTCAVLALNCGPGAFGLMYIDKGDQPYEFSSMLIDDINDNYADEKDYHVESDYINYDYYDDDTSVSSDKYVSTEVLAHTDKDADTDKTIPIEDIDTSSGVENCGGDYDMFIEVLEMYYEALGDEISLLEDLYNNKDWENYVIKIHALKSSSRLAGAIELGEEARSLEMAGKEGRLDYIFENHETIMSHFKELISKLDNYFKELN